MKLSGNTILITGGGSGIGLALAEEFLKLGNTVIVAGRSKEKLAAAAKRGLKTLTVDMTDAASIQALAKKALQEFGSLNVVIHNAGIMKNENLLKAPNANAQNAKVQDETVATNILGPIRLTDALLPHFLAQPRALIMTVSSGLASVPLAMTPTYSASKAAIHSYTQSLRYQLKDTSVRVMELVPPYVQTHLMGDRQAKDPNAMPLADFIAEIMQILKDETQANEILVKRVQPLRFAADKGHEAYDAFVEQFNNQMMAARKDEF